MSITIRSAELRKESSYFPSSCLEASYVLVNLGRSCGCCYFCFTEGTPLLTGGGASEFLASLFSIGEGIVFVSLKKSH